MRRISVALALVVCLLATAVGGVTPTGAQEPAPAEQAAAGGREVERPDVPDVPEPPAPERLPNAGALSPPTEPSSPDDPPTEANLALDRAVESGEPVEVVGWRTETSMTWANPDGSFTEDRAAGPVRVERESGEWVPVDPTLEAGPDGIRPRAVPNDVVLSGGGAEAPLVSLTEPGEADQSSAERRAGEVAAGAVERDRQVVVDVAEELPVPRLDGPRAIYGGALDGADLVVRASTVGTEVSVVIPEPGQGRPVYELPLNFDGLSVEQDDNGGLVLRDAEGVQVGYSPAPIMFDASGQGVTGLQGQYGEVTSRLEQRGDTQVLVVEPDPGFLEDPETKYPVTIDPATDLYPSRDTHVFSTLPNQANDSSTDLVVGTGPWTGPSRGFIRFGTSTFENKTIGDAELIVYQHGAGSCTASALRVYEATDLQAGATWNNQPAIVGGLQGQASMTGDDYGCPSQTGQKSVNIKGLVVKWSADTPTTGTVALRASEVNANERKTFFSLESGLGTPILRVNYLTTPSAPSNLKPAPGTTVDTLAPVLKATMNGGDPGVNQLAVFDVFDANNVNVSHHEGWKQPGSEASWQVDSTVLRPGQAYTWKVRACTPYGQHCSSTVNNSFTVSPGLAAGDRPFFTYTGMDVSDRSGVKVNVASGSLVLSANDLNIAGVNMAMDVTRTYNSFGGGGDEMLGHRWSGTHSNTERLVENPDGSFTFYDASGFVSLITKDDNGNYHTSGDLDADFSDAGGFGVFVLRFNHDRGSRSQSDKLYFYNSGAKKGLLHSSVNRNGQSNVLVYPSGSTTIDAVSDSQSRTIDYTITGGHLTKVVDVSGSREVVYGYDGAGDLRTVKDLNGVTTFYDYDGNHNLTKVTDPNGGVLRIEYDGASRVTALIRENNGSDETISLAYTDPSPGQDGTTVVTDANDHSTTYEWDNANRVTAALNALGQKVDKKYDPNSNVEEITQPGSRTSTSSYDNRNNLESSTMPTGASATASYPSGGTVLDYQPNQSTDHQGNQTGYGYDPAGNLTSTNNSLPTQDSSSATYENGQGTVCGAKEGQVCSTTDARGKVTNFEYAGNGNLSRVVPPAPLGDTDMTYDALSRVKTVDDGKGQIRTYTYDDLDRITQVSYPGGIVFGYAYDNNGNVTDRTEPSGTWAMAYDDANRLLTQNGPEELEFTYDPVGNVDTVTNSNGTTEYDYTDINMLWKLRDPQNAETVHTYEATDGTRRERTEYPNGVDIDFTYDKSDRITEIESYDSQGQLLTEDQYSYTTGANDTALRQKWTNKGNVEQRYTYDQLNRLKTAKPFFSGQQTTPVYTYNYDGVGNRTQAVENGTTRNWTYNNVDQISGATHDANGNITGSTNYGITAGSYNSVDQTTSFTPNGGAARSNSYAGTSQTHWLESGNTTFETTASMGITRTETGSTVSEFTREPDGTLVSMRRGNETFYYVPDGRGSISILTDGAGLQENAYRYGPYGNAEYALENTTQPFRWNAGYTTDGTIYKFGARYYDNTIARWTQVDAVASEPRYVFAAGDPINRVDPTGRSDCGWTDPVACVEESEFADNVEDQINDLSCVSSLSVTAGSIISTGAAASVSGPAAPAVIVGGTLISAGAAGLAFEECSEAVEED